MAHAPGWIELYERLDQGHELPAELVERCRSNRNGLGESMLHWYAIEGAPDVLQRLVELGFDVDNVNDCGTTPIQDAARIARWDNVRVLRRAGARIRGVDPCGESYRSMISAAGNDVPEDLAADAYQLEDLLDVEGPEDVALMMLTITRAGLAADAPGEPLTAAAWSRYLAGCPQHDPDDYPWMEADEVHPAPYVLVFSPDLEARRFVYRAAQHFGARVLWEFAVPG